jgi:signal transduction histidine kinase
MENTCGSQDPFDVQILPTLCFSDKGLEHEFTGHVFSFRLKGIRLAILFGVSMWIVATILDSFAITSEVAYKSLLFWVRGSVALELVALLGLTYMFGYQMWHTSLMSVTFLFIGLGITAVGMFAMDPTYISYASSAIMLWAVFLFGTSGLSFQTALVVVIPVLVFYNSLFLPGISVSFITGLEHNFYVISACGISLYVNYMNEYHLRKEFLLGKQLAFTARETMQAKMKGELSAAKTRFVANISHELKSPLHGICGLTNLLTHSKALSEEEMEHITMISHACESLGETISDILDITKLELFGPESLELHPEEFSLHKLVECLFDTLSWRAREKDIDLSFFIDHDISTKILGDATRFRQILLNLLGNAVKFTQTGYVYLAAAKNYQENQVWLRVEIHDTGPGLSTEQQQAVFQVFTQLDESRSREFEGAGLGLYISKKFIEAMGGNVGVDSEFGKGSCFWFQVPLTEVAEGDENSQREGRLARSQRKGTFPIAVCLRHQRLGSLLCDWLHGCGFESFLFEQCENPRDMSDLLRRHEAELGDRPIRVIIAQGAGGMPQGETSTTTLSFQQCMEFHQRLRLLYPALQYCLYLSGREQSTASLIDGVKLLRFPLNPGQIGTMLETIMAELTGTSECIASQLLSVPLALPSEVEEKSKGHILIIEDNKMNQAMVSGILKRRGYTYKIAENGAQGLSYACDPSKRFDLILTDIATLSRVSAYISTRTHVSPF